MTRKEFDAEMRLHRADCPIVDEAENALIDNPYQETDWMTEAEQADVLFYTLG
jgi:hypothetical protein